ncbi:MAG TPA: zinc-dependent metalloprotease family protein, partial [Flavobacterium sp.]|nr:zinc-dependent metalloprotease family protein [Flavobacterium sp.]
MKNFTLATLVLLLFSTGVCFSQKTYWRFDGTEKTVREKPKRKTVPNEFRVVTLDFNAIKSELAQTAVRGANGLLTKTVLVDFPMEDGTTETFSMEKTYTLAPELEALYPDITSYFGVSRKNPLNKIYVSLSQLGFAGLVTGERTIYIDTYDFLRNDGRYIVYDRNKCSRAENDGFECHADVDMVDVESLPPSMQFRNSTDGVLRTFDLAVACTSEYTYYYGNTVANALAAINTTVTRVNSVYKRDFAVVFQVVASNNRLVYRNNVNIDTTPDPDPYDNYDGSQMLSANTSNITGIIGASAYDVGHVFSTGGGGIASTAPCNATSKGSGVTGIVTPQFDPFDIDYVCHEIGHQFGASHTQNNACQRSTAAAMEPGSGSTIMGYAGICAPNVQNNSDAYFHAYSIQQITGGMSGYTCETETSIANAEPTVSTTASYTIPKSTPFILTATGSDSNGDAITYCWEQMNNGTGTGEVMPPASTNTTRPAFRSFTPTTDPTRTFPNLNAVIANVTPTWEVLPSVARTMNFRCTARDNNSLGGQTNQTNTTLTVSGTAGPFVVTAPNTNETWYVGETKAVTWSVNSTNTLSANVNIKLSTDGGYTYPITLASG